MQKCKENKELNAKGVQECNMRVPENDKRSKKVFVITDMDYKNMGLLFKAFDLNQEMRKEMDLIQDITKLSLYVPQELNDALIEHPSQPAPIKYVFMNLSIR